MADSIRAGLVAGYAVSIPVGALAVLLVNLTARTSLRTGLAGALGVATADGAYAAVAVAGGAAVASAVRQVATPLRLGAALVLLVVAAHILLTELRRRGAAAEPGAGAGAREAGAGETGVGETGAVAETSAGAAEARARVRGGGGLHGRTGVTAMGTPLRAYIGMLGLTLLNPWAIVYFAALMLGHQAIERPGWSPAAFVAAIAVASLSWQALLACGGAAMGRVLTGPRARLVAAVVSAATIVALAATMALPA